MDLGQQAIRLCGDLQKVIHSLEEERRARYGQCRLHSLFDTVQADITTEQVSLHRLASGRSLKLSTAQMPPPGAVSAVNTKRRYRCAPHATLTFQSWQAALHALIAAT